MCASCPGWRAERAIRSKSARSRKCRARRGVRPELLDLEPVRDHEAPAVEIAHRRMLLAAHARVVHERVGMRRKHPSRPDDRLREIALLREVVERLPDVPHHAGLARKPRLREAGRDVRVVHPRLDDVRPGLAQHPDEPAQRARADLAASQVEAAHLDAHLAQRLAQRAVVDEREHGRLELAAVHRAEQLDEHPLGAPDGESGDEVHDAHGWNPDAESILRRSTTQSRVAAEWDAIR